MSGVWGILAKLLSGGRSAVQRGASGIAQFYRSNPFLNQTLGQRLGGAAMGGLTWGAANALPDLADVSLSGLTSEEPFTERLYKARHQLLKSVLHGAAEGAAVGGAAGTYGLRFAAGLRPGDRWTLYHLARGFLAPRYPGLHRALGQPINPFVRASSRVFDRTRQALGLGLSASNFLASIGALPLAMYIALNDAKGVEINLPLPRDLRLDKPWERELYQQFFRNYRSLISDWMKSSLFGDANWRQLKREAPELADTLQSWWRHYLEYGIRHGLYLPRHSDFWQMIKARDRQAIFQITDFMRAFSPWGLLANRGIERLSRPEEETFPKMRAVTQDLRDRTAEYLRDLSQQSPQQFADSIIMRELLNRIGPKNVENLVDQVLQEEVRPHLTTEQIARELERETLQKVPEWLQRHWGLVAGGTLGLLGALGLQALYSLGKFVASQSLKSEKSDKQDAPRRRKWVDYWPWLFLPLSAGGGYLFQRWAGTPQGQKQLANWIADISQSHLAANLPRLVSQRMSQELDALIARGQTQQFPVRIKTDAVSHPQPTPPSEFWMELARRWQPQVSNQVRSTAMRMVDSLYAGRVQEAEQFLRLLQTYLRPIADQVAREPVPDLFLSVKRYPSSPAAAEDSWFKRLWPWDLWPLSNKT